MRRLSGALLALLLVITPALTSTFSTVAEAKPIAIDEEGVHIALELDGVVITGLTLMGTLEATAQTETEACAAGGVCTQLVSQALDELDRMTAGLTEKSRHDTAKNAIGNIRARMADVSRAIGDLDADGYPDRMAKLSPGRPVFGNLTIRRDGLADRSLYAWFQKASAGETARKSGSIIYLDREGQEVARYAFTGAHPTAWKLDTGESIVEELELAVEKVERATAAVKPGAGATEEALPQGRYPVQLLVDGAVAARFASASLAAALPGPDDDCDGVSSEVCDGRDDDCDGTSDELCSDRGSTAALEEALDRLEAAVREAGPANQVAIRRLIAEMRVPLPELEAALQGARRPGPARYSHIILKRGLSGEAKAGQWLNETVNGKPWKRTAALQILGPTGRPLIQVDLGQTEWVSYAITAENGLPVESLALKFIRLELK